MNGYLTTQLNGALTARWHPDGQGATLLDGAGEIVGTLEVVAWHLPMQRNPVQAWVASWLDPFTGSSVLHRAPVEVPARTADSYERRVALLRGAAQALQRGPAPPTPRARAISTRRTAHERFRQVELLIDTWDHANRQLMLAAEDEGRAAEYLRYVALTDLLARTYTVDRTLQGLWDDVPPDLREDASAHADEHAAAAILHNAAALARVARTYDSRTDRGFAPYFERRRTGTPYVHWTGHLLSGGLHADFFRGLRWVRGQMTYRGVIDPIELWQHTDGAAPRWKWKDADAVTAERSNARERALYDELLAGRDVLGLFSHVIDVFSDAKWSLRALLMRAENRRPYR